MTDRATTRRHLVFAKLALLAVTAPYVAAQPQVGVSPSSFEVTVEAGESAMQVLQIANIGDAPLDFTLSTGPGDVADSLFYDNPAQTPQLSVHSHAAVRFQAPHDFTLDAASVWVRTQQGVDVGTIEIAIHPFNPAQTHYPISLPAIGGGTAQFSGSDGQRVQIQLDAPLDFEAGEQFFIIAYVDGGRVGMTSSGQPGWDGRQYYDHQDNGWNIWVFGPWAIRALSLSEHQVLTSDTGSGTIPAGGQLDVTLTASAADRVEGTYNRPILITSNDPQADSLSVPFTLHVVGVSHLELSASELDFGTIVAGQSASQTLTLSNTGTAALTLAAADVSATPFGLDPQQPFDPSVTLEPGASTSFNVVFSPDTPGSYAESLTIGSDADNLPVATVALSGSAQEVPQMTVTPPSVSLEMTTGDVETRTLTLSNTGAGQLDFSFDRFASGHGGDAYGYRWLESVEDMGPAYEWVDIRPTGTELEFSSNVALVEVDLPFAFNFYGEEYNSLTVTMNGLVVFGDGLPIISFYPQSIPNEQLPNGFVAPFWKHLVVRADRGGIYAGTDDHGRFIVQWQELYANQNPSSDLTFQLILDPSADILFQYHTMSEVPTSNSSFTVGIENGDGTDGLQVARNQPDFIRTNLAVRVAATPRWVADAQPAFGSIAPGSSVDVAVTFDPLDTLEGDYAGALAVNSNSPSTRRTHVPLSLALTGVPGIVVSPEALDFGEVFGGDSDTLAVDVTNPGTTALSITDVTIIGDGFFTDASGGFALAPADTHTVHIVFSPDGEGPYTGELTIATNDLEQPTVAVSLAGQGIGAPVVIASPEGLEIILAAGETQNHAVEISNTGNSPLNYSLSFRTPESLGGLGRESVVVDSLVYDSGGAEPENMFGLSHTPLWFAVRYTAPYNFTLNALRAYVTTDTSSVPVQVEIYRKGNTNIPTDGDLLASWTLDELVPEASWVYIPLPASLTFAEGEEFFAVLHFQNVTFPMGQHYTGPAQYWGRSAYRTGGSQWNTVGVRWMMRALTTGGQFISADPAHGSVAAGESVEVTVTVDATGVTPGDYAQELLIASNDPETPELVLPVTIDVQDGDGGAMSAPLAAGWNLVSWNADPPNRSPGVVLAGVLDRVVKVKSYREDGYVVYVPGAPEGANTLHEMDPMYSYWIKLSQPARLWVEGVEIDTGTPLPLNEGLNAVTYLPSQAGTAASALASVLVSTESAMAFAGTGLTFAPSVPDEFQTLVEMKPMSGYYVRTTEAATLVYPPASSGRAALRRSDPSETAGRALTIDALRATEVQAGVDPTMAWVAVWGDEMLDLNGLPLPAGTLVTARVDDDLTVGAFETIAEGKVGLMAVYGDDPTTEEKDGALPGEMVTVYADDVALGSFEWTEFGDVIDLSSMIVSTDDPGAGAPAQFVLDQNYPNPFNANTTIRFALPEAAHVTLRVYDALGRLVLTLVDDERTAGRHEVSWDANGMASGVYIYRIEAGSFSDSVRMLVVR